MVNWLRRRSSALRAVVWGVDGGGSGAPLAADNDELPAIAGVAPPPLLPMKANTVGLVIALLLCAFVGISATDAAEPSFWSFAAKDATGNEVSMETFRSSKAILIVNVASACGYTDQNYRELQQVLYDKYHPKGLEIIAFPCNQFGQQEPNAEPEILRFVKDHYHVSFPVMAKDATLLFCSP
ncbi:hypothetical protein P43SY_011708 [Pythium insidiosum]|uniref:Glutathione peroxidase n=1 Tax=Pythium insidiosum TaxID=114742 RepID=A0AAD5L837_PYTIN|nr:hypothetical protein P43SY_011708 [Pythium insidiosum]